MGIELCCGVFISAIVLSFLEGFSQIERERVAKDRAERAERKAIKKARKEMNKR